MKVLIYIATWLRLYMSTHLLALLYAKIWTQTVNQRWEFVSSGYLYGSSTTSFV